MSSLNLFVLQFLLQLPHTHTLTRTLTHALVHQSHLTCFLSCLHRDSNNVCFCSADTECLLPENDLFHLSHPFLRKQDRLCLADMLCLHQLVLFENLPHCAAPLGVGSGKAPWCSGQHVVKYQGDSHTPHM